MVRVENSAVLVVSDSSYPIAGSAVMVSYSGSFHASGDCGDDAVNSSFWLSHVLDGQKKW